MINTQKIDFKSKGKFNVNKTNSEIRKKIFKNKKKFLKKPTNFYDLDNFIVQNNVKKINAKKTTLNIPIPIYNDLPECYYHDFVSSESV